VESNATSESVRDSSSLWATVNFPAASKRLILKIVRHIHEKICPEVLSPLLPTLACLQRICVDVCRIAPLSASSNRAVAIRKQIRENQHRVRSLGRALVAFRALRQSSAKVFHQSYPSIPGAARRATLNMPSNPFATFLIIVRK